MIKLQFHHYEQWPRLVLGPRHAWHPQPLPPPLPPSTNSTGRNIRRRHRKLKEISRLRILYLGWSIWEEDCASNSALPCDQRKNKSINNNQSNNDNNDNNNINNDQSNNNNNGNNKEITKIMTFTCCCVIGGRTAFIFIAAML